MCGIFALTTQDNAEFPADIQNIIERSHLPHRGPDSQHHHLIDKQGHKVYLYGCVLHFRGELTVQPLSDENKNTLLWNGEIFGGLEIADDENDTKFLLHKLAGCSSDEAVLSILATIRGPWSFVFYQALKDKLWFGRDYFGRRSLLWHLPISQEDIFSLSSIQIKPWEWKEVPAYGIYCYEIKTQRLDIIPWKRPQSYESHQVIDITNSVKEIHQTFGKNISSHFTIQLHEELTIPLKITHFNRTIPKDCDLSELAKVDSHMPFVSEHMLQLAQQLVEVLARAVSVRVKKQTSICSSCFSNTIKNDMCKVTATTGGNSCVHSKLAVLFSGGIDSMMIAALADRFVPADDPIDLLNVAFEQSNFGAPKKNQREMLTQSRIDDPFNVPDRVTGISGLDELKLLYPNRCWNFVKINISVEELKIKREESISNLVYPLQTVLDDSIGCAIWFAARGQGQLLNGINRSSVDYTSPARVVLVGMGADEQLAGYSRHRGIFQAKGWNGLIEEIEMEINRISSRNLGRDDRIITDHARESRFPFLDEDVVSFLNSVPVWKKADLSQPRGFGEKRLLRIAAAQLGLTTASTLPKRAIQFGSRIAKIENRKEKAADLCDRLLKQE